MVSYLGLDFDILKIIRNIRLIQPMVITLEGGE